MEQEQSLQHNLAELERKIEQLEAAITTIQARNEKVEADKAWEMSSSRVFVICLVTYGLAALVLYGIGVSNYLLSALIPTLGFLLSTLTLPQVKKLWLLKRGSSPFRGWMF